jgi:hypothetical protein
VFESVVREVYEIERWVPADSTPYATRPLQDVAAAQLTPNAQNPIAYVKC